MVLFSYNRIYRDQTLSARITRGMFVASYNKISGGEAEFWNGEFFFFSPGNTEFFCFLRNGIDRNTDFCNLNV